MRESANLLGFPEFIERDAAKSLCRSLTSLWETMTGSDPGELAADLEACRRWFDPVAQGQRLRRELSDLKSMAADIQDPGPPLTFFVAPGKRLVTPEGRCALDVLLQLSSGSIPRVTDTQLVHYDRLLARTYRDWSRHRLQSVVDLLTGTTKPLQIPAAGVVIALLVNRCTSEELALTRFASGPARQVVDQAFFSAVQAFADVLAPSARRNRSDPKLVSGWMLYEAGRRLGDGLVVIDARQGLDGKVWIKPESVSHVVTVVSRDLIRGHRAKASPDRFGDAFDALVTALRIELPKLAAFGLVHERPQDTQKLRKRFTDTLQSQLDAAS